jgi:hypothetical protein
MKGPPYACGLEGGRKTRYPYGDSPLRRADADEQESEKMGEEEAPVYRLTIRGSSYWLHFSGFLLRGVSSQGA